MSSSGYTAWNVTAGEVPTTAYWNILGYNDASFNTGNGFNDSILISRHFNWASIFSNSIKSAANGSTISLSNVNPLNLASNGLTLSYTNTGTAYAFVSVSLAVNTTSDFEFYVHIYLNCVLYQQYTPAASASSAGNRAFERSFSWPVILPSGSNTISAGVSTFNGSGSYAIQAGGGMITAFVIGNVTA